MARLTYLTLLQTNSNRIVDVRILAGLNQFQTLEIHQNRIVDHNPLDALPLSHFTDDQKCDMSPLPLEPRLQNRSLPSIFARWSGFDWASIGNRRDLTDAVNLALNDLRFSLRVFGFDFREVYDSFAMTGVLEWVVQKRDALLVLNPNVVHLVDVGIRAAPLKSYPGDSPY